MKLDQIKAFIYLSFKKKLQSVNMLFISCLEKKDFLETWGWIPEADELWNMYR